MRRWLIRRFIAAFERRYDYDMSYAHEILNQSPRAFMGFLRVTKLAKYREAVPLEAWYGAKLAATKAEDCGPCTQLVVRMAEEDGVPAKVLRGILIGDDAAMGTDASLGYRYAEASLAHDPGADELRAAVERRYGARGLVTLALALTVTRMFPTLKYALGQGHACQRVDVAGQPVAVARPEAA